MKDARHMKKDRDKELPQSDMPPPKKPPGGRAVAGAGGEGNPNRKTVRMSLPPKPTATIKLKALPPTKVDE